MENKNNTDNTLDSLGYKQELNRGLHPWQLAIFGLVFMIPIAPFGIYGFLAEASNNHVPLVYTIGMLAMIFTAFSYGRMAEAFPIAGSVYAYVTRGVNPHLGFMTGWAILLDYILMPTVIYLVCGTSMNAIFPAIPVLVWSLFFLALITIINTVGIVASVRFGMAGLAFEMIVYVVFVVFAIIAISKGTDGAHFTVDPIYNAENFSFAMVMNGVSIAVMSFLGFDAISTLAEETMGGGKAVGKATVGALLILGSLFVFLTWVAGCLWPDFKAFENLDIAFSEIANRAGGRTLLNLCTFGTAFSWAMAALPAQTAVSRVLFSMSRDGKFPKPFSKVHKKYKTPYVATWFIAFVSVLMCLLFLNIIDELTSLINFGALTSFFILNLTVIYYYKIRLKEKGIFKYLIFPIIGCGVIGTVWINLSPMAKWVGLAWLVVGLIYYLILTKVVKKSAHMDL